MSSIAELYALQEVDLALDVSRAALDDTRSRLDAPDQLEESREAAQEGQTGLKVARKSFKELEWEADDLREKIASLEARLYEGSVTEPKELADLERDVESLKRRRSELEDQALEAMETMDEAQGSAEEAQGSLEQQTDASEQEHQTLLSRQSTLEEEIVALEQRRSEQAHGINGSLLPLYDRLRANRQGRAVAKVAGGACQGCRISLPMNLLQRARSGNDVVQCTNCERILYMS